MQLLQVNKDGTPLASPFEPPGVEGPLDSLKAMTARVEGLGRSLMELAEGGPRSRSSDRRNGPAAAEDSSAQPPLPLDDIREAEHEGDDLLPPADGEVVAIPKSGQRRQGRGELRNASIASDDEESGGGYFSGFKSSLPPNPFGGL